jgi:hypothetical protein
MEKQMTFPWLDSVGHVADFVTIIGVPALAWSTYQLWGELRRQREERKAIKTVSQDCLEFSDLHQRVAINLVPLDRVTVIPRPGDFVFLPGETHDGKIFGRGDYEVEKISFGYAEAPEIDQPCPAVPYKVVAFVKKREPHK